MELRVCQIKREECGTSVGSKFTNTAIIFPRQTEYFIYIKTVYKNTISYKKKIDEGEPSKAMRPLPTLQKMFVLFRKHFFLAFPKHFLENVRKKLLECPRRPSQKVFCKHFLTH